MLIQHTDKCKTITCRVWKFSYQFYVGKNQLFFKIFSWQKFSDLAKNNFKMAKSYVFFLGFLVAKFLQLKKKLKKCQIYSIGF
jgi:hypothetical protein